MLKQNDSRKGSVHVVIIVALIAIIIGLLGFVFWQNVINKNTQSQDKATTSSETTETSVNEDVVQKSTLNGQNFTLEYPAEGWVEANTLTTDMYYLQTSDYKPSDNLESVVPSVGATIQVESGNSVYGTIQNEYNQVPSSQRRGEIVTINGNPSFSYENAGIYSTSIYDGAYRYHLTYIPASGTTVGMDAYDLAVSSFTVK